MNTCWQQLNGGNTTPFSTRFAAQSTQMESGLGEDRRADAQTAGRLNTSLTITVTL